MIVWKLWMTKNGKSLCFLREEELDLSMVALTLSLLTVTYWFVGLA